MPLRREIEMQTRRILTLGPGNEPLWVILYVQPFEDCWAAMIVADGVLAPGPDEVKGMAFFGATAEEAEYMAHAYLMAGSGN